MRIIYSVKLKTTNSFMPLALLVNVSFVGLFLGVPKILIGEVLDGRSGSDDPFGLAMPTGTAISIDPHAVKNSQTIGVLGRT